MTWRVEGADCVEAMAAMDEASVDAIVTDPPYGLEFMGKEWDRLWADRDPAQHKRPENRGQTASPHLSVAVNAYRAGRVAQEWHHRWATEALRVLKPGGYLLAFGGTRTYHRLACAVEDAGFEIRDCVAWMYGSGFPKSLDVSKAIDRAAGAEGKRGELKRGGERLMRQAPDGERDGGGTWGDEKGRDPYTYLPATPEAARWEGWGTALKPAHEPIVVARKPLSRTVAQNVLAHGTGALNVDGCRVDGPQNPAGRWPANVVLDEQAAEMLDVQSGFRQPGRFTTDQGEAGYDAEGRGTVYGGGFRGATTAGGQPVDGGGGASRFFYCAKASRAERNAGLEGFEEGRRSTSYGAMRLRECVVCGSRTKPPSLVGGDDRPWPACGHDDWRWVEQLGEATKGATRNAHPTVKPIALMRWLVRLVTPPGGTVLDPFCGSGTTGIAARLERLAFVGVERDPDYAEVARARLAWWAEHPDGMELVDRLAGEGRRRDVAESGQLDLLG